MKILFYSPFMSYTGSEMILKYIFDSSKIISPILISGQKGMLIKELSSNVKTYYPPNLDTNKNKLYRILRLFRLDFTEIWFRRILSKEKPDLMVINTLACQYILPYVKKHDIPFIIYVHEQAPLYELLSKDWFFWISKNAISAIGCSSNVCDELKTMGFKKVSLFYECIDVKNIMVDSLLLENLKLNFTNYKKIFIMSGTAEYRKGLYYLPKIAKYLASKEAALIWIGNDNLSNFEFYIQKLVKDEGLSNCFFIGKKIKRIEYYTWMNLADAYILTSLYDPYPLTMIEAAYLQKPIFAFNSGGVNEFVEEGMGKVVHFYNIDELLGVLNDFIDGEINIDYNKLKNKALEHDIEKNITKFEEIISAEWKNSNLA